MIVQIPYSIPLNGGLLTVPENGVPGNPVDISPQEDVIHAIADWTIVSPGNPADREPTQTISLLIVDYFRRERAFYA